MRTALELGRSQVLAYRRAVGALDDRLPRGPEALRRAAWAGIQDSMPRAAVLSLHARIESVEPTVLEDPDLVQVWGPRYSAFVVAAEDRAIFTLGRMADDGRFRQRAEGLATRIRDLLGDSTTTYGEVGRALGVNPNALRYATTTGTILIEWDGARQPTIRSVAPPDMSAGEARLELARRHLHVFGPTNAGSFAKWAGVRESMARAVFSQLQPELVPTVTPVGEAWLLQSDEQAMREEHPASSSVRLLPSGDAYYLLWGDDRSMLVPEASRRDELWTSRVWPGAVVVDGEIVGTWRRAQHRLSVQPWRPLTAAVRKEIEDESASLPLPNLEAALDVTWDE